MRRRGKLAALVMLAMYFCAATAHSDLIGYWKFDDGSGGTAADSSGNGYDLDQVNADGGWIAGKAGGAYNQPRFTADATESDALNLAGSNTLTVSLWVTVHSTAQFAGMVGFEGTGSDGDIWGFKMDSADHPQWTVLTSHGPFSTSNTLANYAAATGDGWVHLVGVFEQGVSSKIYVNSSPAGTGSAGSAIVEKTPPGLFRIGTYYNSGSYEFNGAIDDVQVYNHALSDSDVDLLYDNPGYSLSEALALSPTVDSVDPADEATVATPQFLTITFNQAVTNHTSGNIVLTNLTASTADIISITGGEVDFDGAVLTITPVDSLSNGCDYAVLIDTNAIKTVAAGVFFAGYTETTNWNFHTTIPDTTPPQVVLPFSPADNAPNVFQRDDLIVNFNEPVNIGSGNIVITNLTDASATIIAVTNVAQVTLNNNTNLVINPAADLLRAKSYAVLIETNAIKDIVNNYFAGISDTTTWNFTTRAPGLMGHWKFDDGSGTTAADSSGNGYDLDRVNADGGWIAGKAGGAYNQPRFTADATESDDLNLAGINTLTVSLWVTVHSTAQFAGMVGFEGTGSDGDIWGFKMDDADHPQWTVLTSHGPFSTSNTLANYAAATDDGWVHLVGVFEQGVGSKIYVNSSPAGTGSAASAIVEKTPPGLFRIGTYYNSGNEFNGAIDDVQVYDKALSDSDVLYLYNNPGYALGMGRKTGTIILLH